MDVRRYASAVYKIKVSFLNGPQQCYLKNTVFVKIEACLSLSGTRDQNIKIWPNPTNGTIYFSGLENISWLEVTDFSGTRFEINAKEKECDLGFLTEGIYLLRFFKENKLRGEKRILILK